MAKYLSCLPNQNAGVGHQFIGWASAYSLADMYGLTFAYQPFGFFEEFLPFGDNEIKYSELNLSIINVPRFDFLTERDVLESAITKAPGDSIIHLEVDQFIPWARLSVTKLKAKYTNRTGGKNILASHIRRGQIMQWTPEEREGRFLPNDYFVNVIKQVKSVSPNIESHIYSMGQPGEFTEFSGDTHFHLSKDENDFEGTCEALRAMINADILVMSRSGMSYMAGILSNGINIVHPFWTMISNFSPSPDTVSPPRDWIQCDINGNFDTERLK